MSNDGVVSIEEFEGLKCSRSHCGGPADIVEAEGEVAVVCQHCTNRQIIYSVPEQDTTLLDAVMDYLVAVDAPRYAASHQQSVDKTLTALRQAFNAS